jgi:molybdopterin converting factor small subunit
MANILYYGFLRHYTNTREDNLDVFRVKDIFREIERKYGAEAAAEAKKCSIMVNGKNAAFLKGLGTKLKPEDVVALLQVSLGG